MPNNLISQISNEFVTGKSDEVVDIITFTESSWGLGVDLLPVQRFILKSYYGLPLDDTEPTIRVPDILNERILYVFTEKEFLKWLYEEKRCNTDKVEGKDFTELVLAAGRRATKSTMSACISNYEIYKLIKKPDPGGHYGRPGANVVVLNVAPTDGQSGVVFEMTESMAMDCPFLRDRSIHQTMAYFDIQTDKDLERTGKPRASVQSLAGGCSANSIRGHNAIVVIMDEMAFFLDNSGRFSGEEVYRALTPSIASFGRDGKIICISSPYAKFGRFYGRYQESFDEPDYTLMFRMYSAMVNPTIDSELLKTARRRDRNGFMSEYGAEFSDSIVAWVDDEHEFRRCVTLVEAPTRGVQEVQYFYGIDLGFRNDGTAIVIVHKENGKIVLDYADVWFSAGSDVWDNEKSIYRECTRFANVETLRVSDVVEEVKELAKWFPPKGGTFDQANGFALLELLHQEGFGQFEMTSFTDALNDKVYKLCKRLYAERLVALFDHPVLVREILSLEEERVGGGPARKGEEVSKGRSKVRAPARNGAHDDISDAWSRAVWLCNEGTASRTPKMAVGAGGRIAPGGMVGGRRAPTQQTFVRDRRKAHGEHPRGAYNTKRRMPGGVNR